MGEPEIYSLQEALQCVKEESRKKYEKEWQTFLTFIGENLESRMPTEREVIDYVNYLRHNLNRSSSTIWTCYSMLNTICKGKYGKRLQSYTRLTAVVKSHDVDTKKKAKVFSQDELDTFFFDGRDDPYWFVRKVLVLLSYFGGLRQTEVMQLKVCRCLNF